jgi:hypothetical protein
MNLQKSAAFKCIMKVLLVYLAMTLLGLILILVSGFLPHESIHQHIIESADVFEKEGALTERIPGYRGTIPDNNTDAWMLLIADYNDRKKSLMDLALGGHYNLYIEHVSEFIGMDNIALIGTENPIGVGDYPRYWHGWLLPLRVLLCAMNYRGIRVFNLILVLVLAFICLISMYKEKATGLAVPFLVSMAFLFPYTISQCMAYMISFIISTLSMIMILLNRKRIDRSIGLPVVFMIIGAVTAYSEFLQFPVLTLGLPLVTIIYLQSEKESREKLRLVLALSVMWALGYFGMWISKWVIATLLTEHNVIADALSQIKIRTSGTGDLEMGEKISRLKAVIICLPPVRKLPFVIILCASIIYYVVMIIKNGAGKALSGAASKFVPYLLTALIPLAWILVFANHSYSHNHFTYRVYVVAIFAAFAFVADVIRGEQKGK